MQYGIPEKHGIEGYFACLLFVELIVTWFTRNVKYEFLCSNNNNNNIYNTIFGGGDRGGRFTLRYPW